MVQLSFDHQASHSVSLTSKCSCPVSLSVCSYVLLTIEIPICIEWSWDKNKLNKVQRNLCGQFSKN